MTASKPSAERCRSPASPAAGRRLSSRFRSTSESPSLPHHGDVGHVAALCPLEHLPCGGLVEVVVNPPGPPWPDRLAVGCLHLDLSTALHQEEVADRCVDSGADGQQT